MKEKEKKDVNQNSKKEDKNNIIQIKIDKNTNKTNKKKCNC